ncbi:MAG: endolytic transglycosylase MltG [Solirubrobacterales bacterium]|nr:endolytic transglycosylase MltG [Solirubrobacterales bacterium]
MTPPGDVPPGPARARRSLRGRVLGGVLLLAFALAVFVFVTLAQPFAGDAGEPVRVTIPEGSSVGEIGDVLAAAGIVDSGFLFSVRATVGGKRDDLRSGPHTLREDMSYGAAIDVLAAKPKAVAPPATIDVTIPEGRSRRETVRIVEKAGLRGDYLRASRRSGTLSPRDFKAPRKTSTLEGFLFPATYELTGDATAGQLVERQLEAFKENFDSVSLRTARRKNLTAYDVLIIASMVEREAQLAKERPIIAAVIYNRLGDGMPLGIDATIRYATNNWTRPLRESELAIDSPFNTRKRTGLPPTPIGSPGLDSIRAAARPANVDFLYYVVKPGTCGEHAFSATDAEFQADVQRYNAERARRGGNSPTSC